MIFDHATPEQVDAMINMAPTPSHLAPILEAVRDHGVGFLFLFQNGDALDAARLNSPVPMIVVVGDDTSHSCGPEGFEPSTLRACTLRASCVAILSGEIIPGIYGMFSLMTGRQGVDTLIIETRPEHEAAWVKYVHELSPHVPMILNGVASSPAERHPA